MLPIRKITTKPDVIVNEMFLDSIGIDINTILFQHNYHDKAIKSHIRLSPEQSVDTNSHYGIMIERK